MWRWQRLRVDEPSPEAGLEAANGFKTDLARLHMQGNPSSNPISHEQTGCSRDSR